MRRAALLVTAAGVVSGCAILSQEKAFDEHPKPIGLGLTYPSGSIVTVALAEQALRDAAAQRLDIEEQYRRDEAPCLKRFFVTRCTDAGAERRRIALAEVRAVEVEADYIKRRDRADQRDKAQTERAAQDLADAPERAKEAQAHEKAAADKAVQRASDQAKMIESDKRQAKADPQARQHAHDAKAAQQQGSETAEQGKRAANVAAFEKKQTDAAAAQQGIIEKKAKKAAEAKQAADRAAADAAAAAAAAEKK